MRYTVRKSVIRVVGVLWMPMINGAMTINLSASDVENARDDDGALTRESVEQWLCTHSGDFSQVIDFEASLEDGDATIDIPFASEEGEFAYLDCFASED